MVTAKDNSIAGLLGASPGASTAAPIMLTILERVFKDQVATPAWQEKLHQIVPSYGTKLNSSPAAVQKEWDYTAEILQLTKPPVIGQTRRCASRTGCRLTSQRPTIQRLTWRCKTRPRFGEVLQTEEHPCPLLRPASGCFFYVREKGFRRATKITQGRVRASAIHPDPGACP